VKEQEAAAANEEAKRKAKEDKKDKPKSAGKKK
jgi:hypothetical protein